MAGQTMKRLGLMGLTAAALLSGCATLENSIRKPQVDLRDVQVVKMSMADAQLAFDFDVQNPNPIGLSMRDLSYQLELANKTFSSGSLGQRLRIGANDKSRVTLPVTLVYGDVLDTVRALRGKDELEYRISGDAKFGLFTIPYSQTGSLPLPQLPDVSVQSLHVDRLSLTGAEVAIGLKVNNTNRFPIRFNGLDYQLKLGDASVLNGKSTKPFAVDPNRTETLPLRLNLDYGQIAKVMHALQQGRSLPVGFNGNLKVPGASGEVTLPYKWSGDVPLSR